MNITRIMMTWRCHRAWRSYATSQVQCCSADPPSRYLMAVSQRPKKATLKDSFPPLFTGPGGSAQKATECLQRNTKPENLSRRNKNEVNIFNTGHAWPAATRSNKSSVSVVANPGSLLISGQRKATINPVQAPTSVCSSTSTSAPTGCYQPANGMSMRSVKELSAANVSMVKNIRAAFKEISRQGVIGAEMYIEQFGLSHLILDLARLCPDPLKVKELIEVYSANQAVNGPKGKWVASGNNNSTNKLTNSSILSTARELQSWNYSRREDAVETLSKDGYNKDKSKVEKVSSAPLVDLTNSKGGSDSEAGNKGYSNEGVVVRGHMAQWWRS